MRKYFRFNEIYRETLVEGLKTHEEKILANFAPVIYEVDYNYLKEHYYKLIDLK